MLLGHIDYPLSYGRWLREPIWKEVLSWLRNSASALTDGEHAIQSRDLYATIQTVTTATRDEGIFEAHQEYIDLHYCINGAEVIEWADATTLTVKNTYNKEKDYALYETPDTAASFTLLPGMFAVFLPGEAHMPKLSNGSAATVRKAVVKIRQSLV